MTWEQITVLVAAVLVVAVATELVARWHRGRILAQVAEPGTELVPVAVSTLPVPDPDGWSSQWCSPWAQWVHCLEVAADLEKYQQWFDARRAASERAFAARILRDPGSSPILAELMARRPALAIEPAPQRELEGAQA